MTEPPRRLDPTPAQRVEMAIERHAGGRAASRTRNSGPPRAVNQRSYAHGIPAGGTTGQSLAKLSGDDYDVDWAAGGGGGSPLVAYAAFGNGAVGVALGATITLTSTPFESSGDWATYFDASSGDVALLADGLYAFDAYVHGGSGFATAGGLGVVSFGIGSGSSIRRGVAVVSGGQIWGSVHSQPALWSNGDAWHLSTAAVVNASDGSGATVWCQVYYYGPVV